MDSSYQISGGIYLVLNPAMESKLLLAKLKSALSVGLQVVQIWNNWQPGTDKLALVKAIGELCNSHRVPVLINEEWQLVMQSPFLQGVHFDDVPADYAAIQQAINKPFLAGITCSSNLNKVLWADEHQLNYVSFCSMFPSPSAGSCDIVMPSIVKKARTLTTLPIFVSGGITPENLLALKKETPFNGVAVISGILSADDPAQQVKHYQNALSM
ncbi:thiamine phosphate synthase [Mucilaginibacter robiniae]|uniref:Thiamine phosphate synthase n=2 Tax=Mucilaginibacter robiniae TaxID=2728022 RepID=A0A7L5E5I8_9SPHI|nr:thiamine phosphate synthase [Mucilaginibacter robiniae]